MLFSLALLSLSLSRWLMLFRHVQVCHERLFGISTSSGLQIPMCAGSSRETSEFRGFCCLLSEVSKLQEVLLTASWPSAGPRIESRCAETEGKIETTSVYTARARTGSKAAFEPKLPLPCSALLRYAERPSLYGTNASSS